ncbi:LacI family DNA-binding transcriptional regulator [Thermoanaerobacterium sp. RBIITD]|uniref:LacI family DNA-binding transcriptional regulator n=1 Tax=Thermoanaerobacterium sp. RBIITD TaxID=1550240 RepID=UPI000BB88FF4|nr:LacI family DNA-binding transcriptional regulator [Thermoanaerobacterium sp. RBIITD]SNX53909.1 transcriptional regulator, LacI family [Thermoanaerobacterium sp. RBIITD]
MEKVTLQDIADVIGVSKNTVSKALRGSDGVSAEVKNKILDTAIRMGYKKIKDLPNKIINVTVLCREDFLVESTFWSNVLFGIENSTRNNNLKLSITAIDVEGEENLNIPQTITKETTNGIIIVGTLNDKFIKKVEATKIPFVIVDHYSEEIECDYINSANENGIYKALKYFYENGHKKIGFIGNNEWAYSFKQRYYSYVRYMKEFNLSIDSEYVWLDINLKGTDFFKDVEYFKRKISLTDDFPTAWICANDKIALVFIRSLVEMDINVPDRVSVIGFDNIEIGALSYPALTTVNIPKQALGEKAVQQLIYRMNDPERPYEDIRLSTNLVIRDSVKKVI